MIDRRKRYKWIFKNRNEVLHSKCLELIGILNTFT